MKHKFFTLLFAILASLGTMFAQSGTCGDNLTWNLTDSVLTISGTGAMADYEWNGAPWYSNKESIKSVIIENSVTSIGNYAFEGCSGLTSIDIPNSVTRIGETPFIFCYNLTSINVAANNAYYCSIDGILFNKDKTTLIQCPNGKAGAYIVPDGVINIGEMAFYECRSLTSVIISNSVTLIKGMAFYECSFLTSVTISNSVTKIESDAFYHCTRLTSVEIPNSVTSIGNYAFSSCSSLASLTIPNSVISIGKGAFKYCAGLTSITNYATTPQLIGAEVFAGTAELGFVDKSTCTLYVPAQSIAAYQAADVWKDFKNILPIEGSEEVNYATLADIYNMAADSTFTLGAFDVMYVPDFQNGSNMYIKDSTGSCVIYKVNYGLQAGDHVEAGLQGKVSIYVGLHEIIPITAKEALTITSGEVPAPVEATEVPSSSNLSQYVVYKGVSFATDTAFVEGRRHAVLGSWNGQTITFYNQYYIGATLSANKTYNITAVNTIYRTTPQAYPLAVEEVSPAPCIIASGTCGAQGDNLTWTLSCDSVLTISGTGAMADYWDDAPWYSNINTIRSVIIEDSVTSIGNNAFYLCTGLTSVTIPNSVTSIGGSAFYGCTGLTSMEIPNSVTNIGAYAFYGCTGLTSVTIPNSVTSIGWSAFSNCSSLTSITIPNSVTSIGEYAFRVCSGLTSITNQATTPQAINTNVFTNVNKSTCTLYVPAESVEAYKAADVWKEFGNILPINSKPAAEHTYTVVGSSEVLFGSLWLETDVNNDMILQKGDDTFLWKKEKVTLAAGNIEFKVCEDHSWTQSWPEYNYVLAIAESGVYTIQIYFNPATGIVTADATKQESCVIASGTCGAQGDNLTWMLSCDSVLTISGTGEMHNYGNAPWYEFRQNIRSIIVEEGVTSISKNAFYWSKNLLSVSLPSSVINIGTDALLGCELLSSINVANSNQYFVSVDDILFNKEQTLLIQYPLGKKDVTSYSIPNSVTSIGESAFFNAHYLVSVQMGNGVTTIGKSAFSQCYYLKNMTLGNNVTNIGSGAFYHTAITSLSLPSSVLSIGDWALESDSLTEITVASNNPNFSAVDGVLYNKDISTLVRYPKVKQGSTIIIPNSVTSIGEYAVRGSTKLTSLDIPNNVTRIQLQAFQQCVNLNSLKIPSSVSSIENYAFRWCMNLTSVTNYATTPQTINANVFEGVNISSCTLYVPTESVDAYKAADVWKEFGNILPIGDDPAPCVIASGTCGAQGDNLTWTLSCDSVLIISGTGAMADYDEWNGAPWFSNRNTIRSVIIENSVTSIESGAFYECTGLTSINVSNGNANYCSVEGVLFNKDITELVQYPGGKNGEYTIPNSVTSIRYAAFFGCSSLTTVTIPNSVTSIGELAFSECTGLTSVTIPNSVTSIGEWAFSVCTGLTSVTIPNSVTSIGDDAFGYCNSLTSITNLASIPQSIVSYVFEDVNKSTCTLYVPAESVDAYKAADVWKEFGNILPIDSTEESDYISVTQALEIGATLEANASTDTTYTIRGYVSSITTPFSEQYLNQTFFIADDSLSTASSNAEGGFYVYRGKPTTGTAIREGALVELTTAIKNYNGRIIENAEQNVPVTVLQEGPECRVFSGTCGENVTWTFDMCDSVLTISGTGAMADYNDYHEAPWDSYRYSCNMTVVIEEGVTYIGKNAFAYYGRMKNVTIPSSVLEIGKYAFISSATAFNVDEANPNYSSIDGVLFNKGQTTLLYYPTQKTDTHYTIPNTVNTICHCAFYGADYLTSLEIPNTVITIEGSAFRYCVDLTSVSIPNSVQTIGYDAFEYCDNLVTVDISSSVTSIGNSAFAGCKRLQSINVDEANPNYSSVEGVLFDKAQTILVQYPLGKEGAQYTIPNTVTTLGSMSFSYVLKLDNIQLTSIVIPHSVTRIENSTFFDCDAITSLINYASTPQTINAYAFKSVNLSSCTLYVPAESVDAYKTADVWKEFGNILPIGDDPVVPSDAVLANYYKQGDVCVCFYVPADMGCNDIVLTGSFNGWSSTPAECVKVEPVVGYDGWYVGSFEPEAEPDAVKGIQVKPVMLDVDGNFNWEYQPSAATVIRGSVEVVQGAYAGEVDMMNFGSDVPNVFAIDAWKNNPCTLIYHNYTVTVIIDSYDGCNGLTIPFIVGNMTNWKFEQMQLDMAKTQEYQTAVYYYTFKAAEGTPYQIASGLMDPQTGLVDSTAMPNWYDEAFMQKLVNGVWVRVPGDDGDNQLTHEDAEIVWDLRAEDLRWARCAPEEPTEYTVLAVNLPKENCPEAVEIIGNFDDWAGTAMELLNTGWYFVDLNAKASQGFKFRGAGSWEQVLEYYDAENNTWRELSDKDLIFGKLWQDDTYKGTPCKWIELDCSDNTNYRWTPAASYTGYAIIDGIRYYLDGQTLSATVNRDYDNYGYIINYSGDVVIPDSVTYLGYRYNVTSIGNSAFMNCGDLTSVTIPNNVTYIGYDAFYNCNNLKSITVLGETPATIDYSAFGNTWSMQTIIYVPCGTIDEYKNAWSDYADHIQYLPKTYDYAIYTLVNDGEMGYVTLPASICEEDRMTAMPYDGYHFVRWSDGETMNPRPFVLTSDTTFTAEFAMTLSGNCGKDYALTWVFNPETKTLTISGRGELTENYTFRTAALKAENIVLNNGMTAIGASAFEGCNLLNEIVVPASVTAIWEYAFSKCTNLESITIPNGEAELLYGVVSGCQNLKYIEAPASILRGLYSSDKLKTVKLNGGEASENISSLSGSYNTLQTLNLGKATLEYMPYTSFFSNFRVLKNIVLPENLTKIDYALLADCYYIESIIIPAEVTEIADRAFEDCRSLASVEFAGDKVQRIGDWAFYNCHELNKIDIPEGVTEIGKAAFYGCSYAQVAHLPASVQVIGDNAFAHCSKIAKMEVYAIVPPAVEDKTFYEVSTTAPVYVPENRVQDYKDHPVWGKLNIVGNAPLGVDNVQNGDSKPTKVLVNGQILILRGEKVYTVTGQDVR